MDCNFVRTHLFGFIEGTLTDKERSEFEKHLLSCSGCTRVWAGFSSSLSLIAQRKSEETDPFVLTRLEQKVLNALNGTGNITQPGFLYRLRPVVLGVLLVAAVFTGISLAMQGSRKYLAGREHQDDIEEIRSSMHIRELVDSENTFVNNP